MYVKETDTALTVGSTDQTVVAYDMTHGDDPMRESGDIAPTLQSRMGTGGNQVPVAFSNRGLNKGDITETVRAGCHGALPMAASVGKEFGCGVRRLTPRLCECERLQGFQFRCSPNYPGAWQDELGRWWSPDWTDVDAEGKAISDSARYRMMGNSVAVPVVKWIGLNLKKFCEENNV
jgi:DNA (cytosine-5)-methyltransferase 1